MDRLGSMEIFVKATDLGSFVAAAEATGLSATMVGKHVQFLERRLGVRLLNRTTRRQSLTAFGQAYYDRCKLILAEVEAADALGSPLGREPRGIHAPEPLAVGGEEITVEGGAEAPRHPSGERGLVPRRSA